MKKIIEDMLMCPICDVEKVFLGIHLRRVHKIFPAEAKERFGLKSLTSASYRASRKGEGNSFYGKHHTDEENNRMIMKRDGKFCKGVIVLPLCKGNCGNRVKTYGREYCQACACRIKNSGDRNSARRPEVRRKLVENHAARGPNAKLRSEKLSKSKKGKPRYDMRGDNNPAKRPEVRIKLKANNCMKSREVVLRQIKSGKASPNYPEKYLFNLISSLFPNEYMLNTGGEILRIGNKRPDIVNINGQKKVIEHFGQHWHTPEDESKRIAFFRKFGFECLVIWNKELKDINILKEKLVSYHIKRRFNEHNQNVSNEMVVCSDLHSDVERLAEMSSPVSKEKI